MTQQQTIDLKIPDDSGMYSEYSSQIYNKFKETENIEIIKQFYIQNPQIHSSLCQTPLHIAISEGRLDLVKRFIDEANADPFITNDNEEGYIYANAFEYAASTGKSDCLDFLLNCGKFNLSEIFKDSSIFPQTAQQGNLACLKLLFDAGADIESIDISLYCTALDLCAMYNKVDCAEFLLSKGARLHLKDCDLSSTSENSIILAAMHNAPETLKLLLEARFYKTNKDAKDYDGKLPNELSEELTDKGSDFINHIDSDTGNTALHLSVTKGHYECTQILLENGANIMLEDSSGKLAIDLAVDNGHYQIATLLSEAILHNTSSEEEDVVPEDDIERDAGDEPAAKKFAAEGIDGNPYASLANIDPSEMPQLAGDTSSSSE